MRGPRRLNIHRGIVGDLGTSLLTQLLVVLGNLATLKCAALTMSFDDVGQFVLLRRVVVFVTPMLLLGLGVGLPRSIGRQLSGGKPGEYGMGLLLSGWSLGAAMALVATATLLLFPASMSSLLLGEPTSANLIKPLAWMILGNQLFTLVFAIRRGRLEIQRANLLQAIQIAILPPVIVLWKGPDGIEAVLRTLGFSVVLISVTASAFLLVRVETLAAIGHLRKSLRELVHYGFPRVPGDFAAGGMYALPPILVAHHLDLQSAGLLAVGMSLLTVLSAAFAPIGLVFLPRLSQSLGNGRQAQVRQRLPLLLAATLLLASAIALMGAILGNTLIGWILTESFVFDRLELSLLMVAAGANVVFVVLRNVIDASNFRPLNAIHTSISLGVLLGVWAIASRVRPDDALQAICLATCLAFTTLALLTLWRVCYQFNLGLMDVAGTVFKRSSLPIRTDELLTRPESTETALPLEASCDHMGHERCTHGKQEFHGHKDMEEDKEASKEEVERAHR